MILTGLALQRPLNDAVAEQLRHKVAACEQSVAAQNVEVAAPGLEQAPTPQVQVMLLTGLAEQRSLKDARVPQFWQFFSPN